MPYQWSTGVLGECLSYLRFFLNEISNKISKNNLTFLFLNFNLQGKIGKMKSVKFA